MYSFHWSSHTLLFSVDPDFSVPPIPLFYGFPGGSWVEGATHKTQGKGLPPDAYSPDSETKPISACARA